MPTITAMVLNSSHLYWLRSRLSLLLLMLTLDFVLSSHPALPQNK